MRTLIKSSLPIILVLSMLLAGCGGGIAPTAVPEPTKEAGGGEPQVTSKELNLYGWSEYVPQDMLDAFTAKYGIKVNYDAYASNEELLAKLQAGASGYDVIIPSDYMVTLMSKLGMLEPLNLSLIPNFVNIGHPFKNAVFDPNNKYSVPYQWGTVGIAVNKSKVDKPITRWADLWDPAFKSNLVVLDDEREVLGFVLVTLGYDKNSTDPKQLEEAKQKMLELTPNIKLYDSDSPKTALLSGEVVAGVVWNGEAALAHMEDENMDYVLPEEGCGLWYDNLAIPKDPPHKDAAHLFINWVLSPDMSILITRDFPYSNPNTAALELMSKEDPEAYETYMGFAATNPPADAIKKCHLITDVGEAMTLWDKVWTEVKGGQ